MSIGSEIMEEYYDREIIPPLKNLIKLQKIIIITYQMPTKKKYWKKFQVFARHL